jgi:aspartyl-tRNA(Asn)/glutamyl-tRNA(Gln) amidotransferase subunit B
VDGSWIERVSKELPELPHDKRVRLMSQYGLNTYNAWRLTEEQSVADYFEQAAKSAPPQFVANWMLGDLFSLMNQANRPLSQLKVAPAALAELVNIVSEGQINQSSAKEVLAEMFASGKSAAEIVAARGLKQVSDESFIADLVRQALAENAKEVASYKAGKAGVANFLFGQVMKKTAGKANPQVVRAELDRQLAQ